MSFAMCLLRPMKETYPHSIQKRPTDTENDLLQIVRGTILMMVGLSLFKKEANYSTTSKGPTDI